MTDPQSMTPLIGVVALFLVAIMGLLVVLIRQRRQIDQLQTALKPKYGFLGKPLMSVAAIALMAGGFAFTYYASQNLKDPGVSADRNVEIQINTKVSLPVGGTASVDFKAIPLVNGKPWNDDFVSTFDIFWTIKGPLNITEVELAASQRNPSGLVRNLPVGAYEVRVDIIYAGRTWTKTTSLQVGL